MKIDLPKPNIELLMGCHTMGAVISFREKKDTVHRLKWWVFCKVFPFEYRWIDGDK